MKFKFGVTNVLFWSVISAAFIGPGTVTTAASAGSNFGLDLVYVLIISTFACIVLQINVARITIDSGKTLGELLLDRFGKSKFIPISIVGSIVFGCATYQAGNLLGAKLGAELIFSINRKLLLLTIVFTASLALWFGSVKTLAKILGVLVAIMGFVFLVIAFSIELDPDDLFKGAFIPGIPEGAELMIMGLLGTTIVPYNLFLGSGLSTGRDLVSSRWGLAVAISLGGAISIAILICGSLVEDAFSFEALSIQLSERVGLWAKYMLGFGLMSAGITSAMTAPIAAFVAVQGIVQGRRSFASIRSTGARSIWMPVMAVGLFFSVLDFQPIPLIILAQAVNGIILPFISVFILLLVWKQFKSRGGSRHYWRVVSLAAVVAIIVGIGVINLLKLMQGL
jgi:Mn2+/Fe2+ NRAMP family transporter